MKRYITNDIKALVVLVLIFISLTATSALRKSPTADEAAHHVPTGYVFLKTGDFVYATDSPPFARCIAALPLLFLDIELPNDRTFWARDDRAEFSKEFLYGLNRNLASKIILLARIPIILLGVFGGCFLFWWVKKRYDSLTAVIAATFYFLSPNILAHARFATTDMAATVLIMCSVLSFWDFLRKRQYNQVVMSGIFLGLAMMAKYSALLLLPVYFILVLSISVGQKIFKHKIMHPKFFLKFILCLFIAIVVLWAGYAFEFKPFLKNVLRSEDKVEFFASAVNSCPLVQEKFRDKAVEMLYTVPIPLSSFILGVLGVLRLGIQGTSNFFMGTWRSVGHPLFYILAFSIKTPIAIIISFFIGIWVSLKNKSRKAITYYFLLIITTYFIFASRSNLQLGIRYILPIYPLLFIIAAVGLTYLLRRGRIYKIVGVLLICWLLTVQLFIWPDYLSYFNEIVGGPRNGYKYLRDSNIDWGQDLPALAKYMKGNNVDEVTLVYFGTADPSSYGIKYKEATEAEMNNPGQGVYAVSVHKIESLDWAKQMEPTSRAGYSIFIYDFRIKE